MFCIGYDTIMPWNQQKRKKDEREKENKTTQPPLRGCENKAFGSPCGQKTQGKTQKTPILAF